MTWDISPGIATEFLDRQMYKTIWKKKKPDAWQGEYAILEPAWQETKELSILALN